MGSHNDREGFDDIHETLPVARVALMALGRERRGDGLKGGAECREEHEDVFLAQVHLVKQLA